MLDVHVVKRLGAIEIDCAFRAEGRVTALFGPSGAGKTSVLNMIAGLIEPERGHIRLDAETLFDGASDINVPVHRRRIGYVFQEGRLLPHLSVAANLNYGRLMNGLRKDAHKSNHVVGLLGIADLMQRRPGALSGGERQRVAIGRALLSEPRLLLLDEPLASLDQALKAEILPYLKRLKQEAEMPMVYVSHVAAEVEMLADTIVRIENGRSIDENARLDCPS